MNSSAVPTFNYVRDTVQDWEYKYSATQNNGQITAMKDWTSGEEVNYAYDELKRLASAVTVGPEWGNSYVYDGFGNLLQKNVVKGTAPYMNLSIDPATNKPYSGYSAAGLPTVGAGFDNDNRMISTTAGSSYQEYYAYSLAGKRVWNRGKRDIGGTWVDKEEVWFWGVTGQRMAFYSLTASGNPVFTLTSTNLYMGSKLVMSGGVVVKTDRLGSVGKFYPWGEERTPTGVSGEKFATYYHDVQAAMNYADQRWHGTNGRFQVPDPYRKSARVGDSVTWNRYAYVGGEPINRRDRSGQEIENWDWENCEWNGEEWACEWVNEPGPEPQRPDTRPNNPAGSGGGNNGVSEAARAKAIEILKRVRDRALKLLEDPDCLKLFRRTDGSGILDPKTGQELDPQVVLKNLVQTTLSPKPGQFGYIDFKPGGDGGTVVGVNLNMSLSGPYYDSVIVFFNVDLWNNIPEVENVTALLHELGHVINKLSAGVLSNNWFKSDAISDNASLYNTRLVEDNCLKVGKP